MPSRNSQRYQVRINGLANTSYEVMRIEESAGGELVDNATMLLVPNAAPLYQDYSLAAGMDSEVEIVAVNSGGQPVGTNPVKHWGRITSITPQLGPAGRAWTVISRTQPHHFGQPVRGNWVWSPTDVDSAFIDTEMIFNPLVDGKIHGNKHPTRYIDNSTGSTVSASVFLDPESCATSASSNLQGGPPEEWTLATAILSLCWTLNPDEKNIKNPASLLDLTNAFSDEEIRDVKIPKGMHLPAALDLLCKPVGYRWKLSRIPFRRDLVFLKQGDQGGDVWINHQRLGQQLNLAETNVKRSSVGYNASATVNKVVIQGSPTVYEFTVELARGWIESHDDKEPDLLRKSGGDFTDVRDVYRRWVLNEAGDYIGMREEIAREFTTDFRQALEDLTIAGEFIPRRRKLLPTLTLNEGGTQPVGSLRGVDVEYLDLDNETWIPIGNWGCKILEQEAGIYFDGEDVPEELLFRRADARVRVTATLESDFRVTGTSVTTNSPLAEVSGAVVAANGKYQNRVITTESKYSAGSNPTIAVDDFALAQGRAARMAEAFDRVDVAGNVVLEGVDQHQYQLLNRVLGIRHRNVSFEAKSGSGIYPQIVGVTYDIQNQVTVLELQRMRRFIG